MPPRPGPWAWLRSRYCVRPSARSCCRSWARRASFQSFAPAGGRSRTLASAREYASFTYSQGAASPASLSTPHRAALALAALAGPLAGLLAPLAHASSLALHVVAAVVAAALVGAYVALAVLLARAVLRVVRPRFDGRP